MRRLSFSLYRCATDTKTTLQTLTWDEWITRLGDCRTSGGKDGPGFIPGHIENGAHRNDKNVSYIDALCLDIDATTLKVIEHVQQATKDYESFWYTTHRHNPDDGLYKLRAVFPLDKPLPPERHADAWHKFNHFIGGHNDANTKNISRFYYGHSTAESNAEHATTFHNATGQWIALDWLLSLPSGDLTPSHVNAPKFAGSAVLEIEDLKRISQSLRRSHDEKKRALGDTFDKLSRGKVFANPGERDGVIFAICVELAYRHPSLNPEQAAQLFRPSLVSMDQLASLEPRGVLGTMDDIATNKLPRALRYKQEAQAKNKESRMSEARGDDEGHEYTPEELEHIATSCGIQKEELRTRWIIYSPSSVYFLNLKGYQGPFPREYTNTLADLYLKPIPNVATYHGDKRKTRDALLSQYGTFASNTEASLVAAASHYDNERNTITLATAPRDRTLQPRFHPDVHLWLEHLGGRLKEKLLDWIACVPKLEDPCCGLYLYGAPNVGKSFLANGLARIWEAQQPTPIEVAFSEFNEDLSRAPLVLADEYVPDDRNISGKLRDLISTRSITIGGKYKANARLVGSIRLMLCANTGNLIKLPGDPTNDDVAALAQRFLVIEVKEDAGLYLKTIPPERLARWASYAIAEHCLYLADNREFERGRRFLVEGDLGSMGSRLLNNNDRSSSLTEILTRLILEPEPYYNNTKARQYIQRDDDAIWVNAQVFAEVWEAYLSNVKPLGTRQIGNALNTITTGQTMRLRVGPRRVKFRQLRIDHVAQWADAHGLCDEEDFETIAGALACPIIS